MFLIIEQIKKIKQKHIILPEYKNLNIFYCQAQKIETRDILLKDSGQRPSEMQGMFSAKQRDKQVGY